MRWVREGGAEGHSGYEVERAHRNTKRAGKKLHGRAANVFNNIRNPFICVNKTKKLFSFKQTFLLILFESAWLVMF
jgi:hypothetical protein